MKRNRLIFTIALTVFLTANYLLFTGSSLLIAPLYQGSSVPWGSLITWFGLISLPLLVLTGFRALTTPKYALEQIFSKILRALLILAILWLPICYLLAGNPGFNFADKPGFQGGQTAMKIFWFYSLGLPVATLICLLAWRISRMLKSK